MNDDTDKLNLHEFLPYRISIFEQRMSKTIANNYMNDFGISRMEWRVMASLAEFEKLSAREICRFTFLEKMQVSRAISHFRQAGMVIEKKNNEDQRLTELSLSQKGWKIYRQIVPLVKSEEKRLLSSLSATEQKQLKKILHKLEQAVN